jgi:hypothetical protein
MYEKPSLLYLQLTQKLKVTSLFWHFLFVNNTTISLSNYYYIGFDHFTQTSTIVAVIAMEESAKERNVGKRVQINLFFNYLILFYLCTNFLQLLSPSNGVMASKLKTI